MINADTQKLIDAARSIKGIDKVIADRATFAVNETARKYLKEFREQIFQHYMLKKRYIAERSRVVLWKNKAATTQLVHASIRARYRHTTLATYGYKQLIKKAKNPKRAKGDSYHGIMPGSKQAGIAAKVLRLGATKRVEKWFTAGLKNTNQRGIFIRVGKGKSDIEHKYGPSVHSGFKFFFERDDALVAADLRILLNEEIQKAVKAQMARQQI